MLVVDLFLQIELIAAISSALLFYLLSFTNTQILMNEYEKDLLDWVVAVVFVFIWLKPVVLFYVVPSISKMLQTLIFMLKDVIPFLIIMLIYVIALT